MKRVLAPEEVAGQDWSSTVAREMGDATCYGGGVAEEINGGTALEVISNPDGFALPQVFLHLGYDIHPHPEHRIFGIRAEVLGRPHQLPQVTGAGCEARVQNYGGVGPVKARRHTMHDRDPTDVRREHYQAFALGQQSVDCSLNGGNLLRGG